MFRLLALGSIVFAVTACVKNGPTEDEYNDVAQAIGSTTSTGSGGGEVGSFSDSTTLALGGMPAGLTLSGSGHVSGQHLGLDYDYTIACTNSAGATLPACGSTTDRAAVTLSWSGSLDTPNLSASVERSGNWTLSNVQSGSPTFNGQGTFSFDIAVTSIFRPVTSSYHLDYSATYSAVQLDSTKRPVGGSVHYAISADHTITGTRAAAEGSFDLDAVVTFHSDGTATLTLDGKRNYSLNLTSGAVVKM